MGHGHVTPNPDGTKAKCGGPAICPVCKAEAEALAAGQQARRFVRLPTPDKSDPGEAWRYGPEASIDPAAVVAVEPRQHRYHSFRSAQDYAVVHLSTGGTIEVFASADLVMKKLGL